MHRKANYRNRCRERWWESENFWVYTRETLNTATQVLKHGTESGCSVKTRCDTSPTTPTDTHRTVTQEAGTNPDCSHAYSRGLFNSSSQTSVGLLAFDQALTQLPRQTSFSLQRTVSCALEREPPDRQLYIALTARSAVTLIVTSSSCPSPTLRLSPLRLSVDFWVERLQPGLANSQHRHVGAQRDCVLMACWKHC